MTDQNKAKVDEHGDIIVAPCSTAPIMLTNGASGSADKLVEINEDLAVFLIQHDLLDVFGCTTNTELFQSIESLNAKLK